jgi:hypothetical protein
MRFDDPGCRWHWTLWELSPTSCSAVGASSPSTRTIPATSASPRARSEEEQQPRPAETESVLIEVTRSGPPWDSGPWRRVGEWADDDGHVVAVGSATAGRRRMELVGFGTFEWGTGDEPVTVQLVDGRSGDDIDDAFSRSVLPFVLHTRGTQVVHASAVLGPHGLIVICARSGTGKSTLAYALSRRPGMELWADDAVALDVSSTEVAALALPFSLRLRPESARYFEREAQPIIAGSVPDARAKVATVIVLERSAEPDSEVAVHRLTDVHAFTSVLEHAYCFSLEGDYKRETSEAYLSLVTQVPVYSVRFPGRMDLIPAIVDELVRLG